MSITLSTSSSTASMITSTSGTVARKTVTIGFLSDPYSRVNQADLEKCQMEFIRKKERASGFNFKVVRLTPSDMSSEVLEKISFVFISRAFEEEINWKKERKPEKPWAWLCCEYMDDNTRSAKPKPLVDAPTSVFHIIGKHDKLCPNSTFLAQQLDNSADFFFRFIDRDAPSTQPVTHTQAYSSSTTSSASKSSFSSTTMSTFAPVSSSSKSSSSSSSSSTTSPASKSSSSSTTTSTFAPVSSSGSSSSSSIASKPITVIFIGGALQIPMKLLSDQIIAVIKAERTFGAEIRSKIYESGQEYQSATPKEIAESSFAFTFESFSERVTWSEREQLTGIPSAEIHFKLLLRDARDAQPSLVWDNPPDWAFPVVGTSKGLSPISLWQKKQEDKLRAYFISHVRR